MKNMNFDVVFVTGKTPLLNVGGPSTYNYSILDSLIRLKLNTLILVSDRRLPKLLFSIPRYLDYPNIKFAFLHANSLSKQRYAVNNLVAAASMLKARIRQYVPTRSSTQGTVKIERFPDPHEISRAANILDRTRSSIFLVDTIFRDAFIADRTVAEKRVLIAHDVFHERTASFEANGYRVTPRIDAEEERRRVSRYPVILAISDRDARSLRRLAPDADVKTVFPIVQASARPATTPDFRSDRILYVGTAAHHNVDGLKWFLEHAWPLVRQAAPAAILDVIGSIGSAIEPQPNVVLHHHVDNLSAIASKTAFAINPVRMGSGIKIKMVDYFNLGLGCITTSAGAQGFPVADRPFVIHDQPAEFAAAVLDWVSDAKIPQMMSSHAQRYTRHFSTDALDKVMRDLIAS